MLSNSQFPIHNSQLDQLIARAKSGRAPHAVILEGESEENLLSDAMLFARAVLCKCGNHLDLADSQASDDDHICRPCRLILSGNHPDVFIAEGSGKTGAIPVDEIRRICAEAMLKPIESESKVFILPNCGYMGIPAQNAFLKALEEPPAGVFFLLLCRSAQSLLSTIRSRAWTVSIGGKDEPHQTELAEEFCLALCASGNGEAMRVISVFCRDKKNSANSRRDFSEMLSQVREILRIAIRISVTGNHNSSDESSKAAARLARSAPAHRLTDLLREIDTLESAAKLNVSMSLLTAQAVIKLKI